MSDPFDIVATAYVVRGLDQLAKETGVSVGDFEHEHLGVGEYEAFLEVAEFIQDWGFVYLGNVPTTEFLSKFCAEILPPILYKNSPENWKPLATEAFNTFADKYEVQWS